MAATCGLDFERRLSASSFDVRSSIVAALRELGFEVTVEQLTRVEAKRGGMLGASLMMKKQMPVRAVFEIGPDGTGCTVAAHLADGMFNFGKTWGVNRQFSEVFEEIQRRVDLGLAKLDGPASLAFAGPRFWSRSADIAVLEQSSTLTAKAVGGAVGSAGKMLDGSTDRTPKAWKGVDSVTFVSSAGVAVLSLAETQAGLGIAVLVVSHPGAMPADQTRDVETFAATVERTLTAAAGRAVRMDVADPQQPVVDFLHEQAHIRSELPMRELHICRSCRLEKITNPEYERIAARNEKIGDLVAGVGATISKGGISPTFVLGQVFKLKKLDPDFVCSRCQGMEADELIVTFCPSCAELQRDVVLRVCPKCGFDFRTKAGPSIWGPIAQPDAEQEAAPAAPAAPPTPTPPPASNAPPVAPASTPVPPTAPAAEPANPGAAWPNPAAVPLGRPHAGSRGKVCQLCRREYPSLWRVVISTPAGFEERFICGTTATCQMPSLVPAVQV